MWPFVFTRSYQNEVPISFAKSLYLWVGEVYTMENKDTNTDYQKFARVGDRKWEIVDITIGIIFLLENSIHYFLYREFSSPTWKKSPPPEVPIPTQKPNLIYVPPI